MHLPIKEKEAQQKSDPRNNAKTYGWSSLGSGCGVFFTGPDEGPVRLVAVAAEDEDVSTSMTVESRVTRPLLSVRLLLLLLLLLSSLLASVML